MKLLAAAIVCCLSVSASADPEVTGRVITAPTAWLPPEGGLVASGAIDQRGDGSYHLAYGLGALAALELGGDTDMRACSDPCEGRALPKWENRAAFTLQAPVELLPFPRVALGLATTFDKASLKAIDLHLVASAHLGRLRLHAGVEALQARVGDETSSVTLRPIGGLEVTPPQYPKTSLLVDFTYVPRLDVKPRDEWVLGWGVRYQARPWWQVELAVRHRQDEGLGDSTVMGRMNVVIH